MCLSVEPSIRLVNISVHFVAFVIFITVILAKVNNKHSNKEYILTNENSKVDFYLYDKILRVLIISVSVSVHKDGGPVL